MIIPMIRHEYYVNFPIKRMNSILVSLDFIFTKTKMGEGRGISIEEMPLLHFAHRQSKVIKFGFVTNITLS